MDRLVALAVNRRYLMVGMFVAVIIGGLAFPAAYTMVAWSSWVPNWLAVEWWLRKRKAVAR